MLLGIVAAVVVGYLLGRHKSGGILLGRAVRLYRSKADVIQLDG